MMMVKLSFPKSGVLSNNINQVSDKIPVQTKALMSMEIDD